MVKGLVKLVASLVWSRHVGQVLIWSGFASQPKCNTQTQSAAVLYVAEWACESCQLLSCLNCYTLLDHMKDVAVIPAQEIPVLTLEIGTAQ